MATHQADATSETSSTENFSSKETANSWDDVADNLFWKTVDHIKGSPEDMLVRIEELVCKDLPTLARHFDGKALAGLKEANPWLVVFEPGSIPRWEKAKTAFVENGPAFLDVLASFTDLTISENLLGIMLAMDMNFSTQLLLVIRDELVQNKERMELLRDSGRVNEIVVKKRTKLADHVSQACEDKGVTRDRIEALLKNRLNEEDSKWSYSRQLLGGRKYEWVLQSIWETKEYGSRMSLIKHDPNYLDVTKIQQDFLIFIDETIRNFSYVKKANVWHDYMEKVQSFVRQVGCANVHHEPEENIAELRLFHSTTIGYFAKLQDQYLRTELEVKKLRHYITALEFRYLLEHLPDIKLDQKAGPRWEKFWKQALEDEANDHLKKTMRVPDHALKNIVDKRNPKRTVKNKKEIHMEGAKGFLYITGKTMYSILSDEIHQYRGDEYEVGDDDGWTDVVTDILRALKPLEANIDTVTHEVNWAAERQRYTA